MTIHQRLRTVEGRFRELGADKLAAYAARHAQSIEDGERQPWLLERFTDDLERTADELERDVVLAMRAGFDMDLREVV